MTTKKAPAKKKVVKKLATKKVTKKKVVKKKGKPTTYSDAICDVICEGIAEGRSLARICQDDNMPRPRTVYDWLRRHPEFLKNYEYAKEDQADFLVEEILDIVDNQASQPVVVDGIPLMVDDKPVMVADNVSVAHARLRHDARKWAASKFKPKKYGDKLNVENTGAGGGPIRHEWSIMPVTTKDSA